MNKPEKKRYWEDDLRKEGYNQAIDDYEKFLSNKDEMLNIILDISTMGGNSRSPRTIAEIIAKRIGKL